MQTEKELTFEQLCYAYLKGQRTFSDIEIVGKDCHLLISGITFLLQNLSRVGSTPSNL